MSLFGKLKFVRETGVGQISRRMYIDKEKPRKSQYSHQAEKINK